MRLIQRHFARGVAAAAQLLRNFARGQRLARHQRAQKGRFAHAGVAAEHAELAGQHGAQRRQPLAGGSVHAQHGKARRAVALHKRPGVLQIALGDNQHRLGAAVHRNGAELVNDQRAGRGLHRAGHNEELVYIGHGRPHKYIFARQHLGNDGCAGLVFQPHAVARHRGDAPLAENALGAAFHNAIGGFHIVKTADAFYNIRFCVHLISPRCTPCRSSARPARPPRCDGAR